MNNSGLLIEDTGTQSLNIPDAPTISIQTPSGKTLNIDCEGDKIGLSGDAEVSEAAQIFFDEVIKIARKTA